MFINRGIEIESEIALYISIPYIYAFLNAI